MPATRSPAKALFGAALLMFAAAWAVRAVEDTLPEQDEPEDG